MSDKKPRVLVVDDEPVMADMLKLAFAGKGWLVDVATSAAEAQARLRAVTPDVILTDKNLPDRSGVDLIRDVRRKDEAVGIVLMTGYGTVESARDTLNLGIDAYIEKPFPNVFGVVSEAAALAERVAERRKPAAAVVPTAGPITAVVAASDPFRRALIAAPLASARLVYVEEAEAIRATVQTERADLVVLDGKAFPDEVTPIVTQLRARVRGVACVVLCETLTLSDVKRLIELEVKALIDSPLESDRFATHLGAAVERVRRARR